MPGFLFGDDEDGEGFVVDEVVEAQGGGEPEVAVGDVRGDGERVLEDRLFGGAWVDEVGAAFQGVEVSFGDEGVAQPVDLLGRVVREEAADGVVVGDLGGGDGGVEDLFLRAQVVFFRHLIP